MRERRSPALLGVVCLSMLAGTTCRRPSAADYLASLPDLPPDLVSTLDPATMATRVVTTMPVPVLQTPPVAAPCCASNDVKKLQVSYAYTKCAPLRDFIVADISDVRALFRARAESTKTYRLRELNRTVLDNVICMTSSGPWNATLTEQRSCVGYAPVQSLVVDAYGDLVLFSWNGGTADHPADIGLVSCRQVGTTRFNCGISSCQCPSSSCPAADPCECGLQW